MRKMTLITLLAVVLAVLASGTASAAVHIGKLVIEDQNLHSTMHTILGSLPKFTDGAGENRAGRLNDLVGRFYDEVMRSASPESGGPYPPIVFAYDVYDSGRYLSVVLHGSVSAPNTESHIVRTIVLDRRTHRILTLRDILGKDGYAAAERYIHDEMRREPSRYMNSARLPKVDDHTSFYMNGNGDLVFIFDKYAIAPGSEGTPEFVYHANALPKRRADRSRMLLVSGRILEATMNTIVIRTDDGRRLAFSTVDADKTKSHGLLDGSRVEIYYTGTIEGSDTSRATVVHIRQPKTH